MPLTIYIIFFVLGVLSLFAWCLRMVHRWQWKSDIQKKLIGKSHAAAGIEYAGFFLGVWIVVGSFLDGISIHRNQLFVLVEDGSMSWLWFTGQILAYGILSIFLLLQLGYYGVRILLNTNLKTIVHTNNTAAGLVLASGYIASSFLLAGILSGTNEGGNILTLIVFLFTGFGALLLFTYLFRFLTAYDDRKEILDDNNAAALSYGGVMIALGIIIGHALEGNFIDYASSFFLFGKSLLIIVALYPVRQILVQGILLGGGFHWYGGKLDEEIIGVHNIGAGAVEAAAYLAFASLATHLGY